MKKLMKWMTEVFAPKMNKIARNPWIAAIQESILTAMPVIFIGSFATIISLIKNFVPAFPDISNVSTFSIGFLSLYLSYLVPSTIMEKKKHNKTKREAGIAGIAFFLMLVGPTFDKSGNIAFSLNNLGEGGMIASLVSGLFVGMIMNLFANHSFFKEDSALPDFVTVWFDTLIPMLLILLIGWLAVFVLKMNLFNMIYVIFNPLLKVGDTFFGFVILYFVEYTFLYTFGLSTWLLYPIESAIVMQGIGANQAAVAAGHIATRINAYGASYYFTLGGGGCTLALGLMLFFLAKSKKLKVIGKASIVPTICNINEPLVFGAPIAFNPILMVPMWIAGLFATVITYLALYFRFVPRVSTLFSFWYLPAPICTTFIGGIPGLILFFIIFAVTWVIYYPFFKVYDKQCCDEEAAKEAAKHQ